MSDSAGTSLDSARQRRPRTHLMCFFRWVAILNMLNEAAGRTFFSFASGVMVRPLLSLFLLMYAQSAFTTSVRAILFLPQIAARSAESVLVAKRPMPFFFIAAAFFLPADRGEVGGERLGGEETNALLLHRRRILLARSLRRLALVNALRPLAARVLHDLLLLFLLLFLL